MTAETDECGPGLHEPDRPSVPWSSVSWWAKATRNERVIREALDYYAMDAKALGVDQYQAAHRCLTDLAAALEAERDRALAMERAVRSRDVLLRDIGRFVALYTDADHNTVRLVIERVLGEHGSNDA